jgi:hypothetical protein
MAVSKEPIEAAAVPTVETGGDEHSEPRDEQLLAMTSGTPPGTSGRSFLAYGSIGLVVVAYFLVNSLSVADDVARRGGAYRLDQPMLFEGTSAIATLALLPLMRRGVAFLRAGRSRLVQLARAALVGTLFAFGHILIMVVLRKLAYSGVGASYEFNMATGLPYEFRKDIVSALLIGLAFWLLDRPAPEVQTGAEPDERARPGAPASPLLWLRDGSTSIRVDAREIVWVASAGNYVEFALPARRHLVRGTLAGEEARLSGFGIVRVHRTRLVNLAHVIALEPRPSGDFALRLDTGEVVTGSRRYKENLAALKGAAADVEPPRTG